MRSREEREVVRFLAAGQINASQIADITRIPRSTVCRWLAQPEPKRTDRSLAFDPATLPEPTYSYLFGFYLGDGTITRHPRDVYRLTIVTDSRYPGVVAECAAAILAVMPVNRVRVSDCRRGRAVEIGCYSKCWPLLFPQHGPGRKHTRKIELVPWQQEIVDRYPRELLRGLIHSDGCRVLNRVNGTDYPRYFFSQVSDDIRRIFCGPATASVSSTGGTGGTPSRSPARSASRSSTLSSARSRSAVAICARRLEGGYSRARRLSRCATG